MELSPASISEQALSTRAYECLLRLATEDGINASGKDDVYGCIFGRDSAITISKILNALSHPQITNNVDTEQLLSISQRGLLKLCELQGSTTNIESGEEPGKFIHEYRTEKYERLLTLDKPWYIYPDKILRNYDSIDSTPLALNAIYQYWKLTGDGGFLLKTLPAVERGLNWIISYGDKDKDHLLEYEMSTQRQHGGLVVQSWTDSIESVMQEDNKMPMYPIAPVEVQGYTWLALNQWAQYYEENASEYGNTMQFAQKLRSQAQKMKEMFNALFWYEDPTASNSYFLAQALDGEKNQLRTVTGNPLLLLWASYEHEGKMESIVDTERIPSIIQRSFMEDMFDEHGGVRTMSTRSRFYRSGQNSYHNGSFWPKLNGMAHEGLIKWGYYEEAARLKAATIYAMNYFGSPIELYIKMEDGTLVEYLNELGQASCKEQAWSAATLLDLSLHTHNQSL